MKGAHRSVLRSLAGRRKWEGTLGEMTLSGKRIKNDDEVTTEQIFAQIPVSWMEELDAKLWDHELVLLRLGQVVSKKKKAGLVGSHIAENLNAHVAQVVGHTVLLYRPGSPPVLDLEQLIRESSEGGTATNEGEA